MRTTLVLDDELLAEAQALPGCGKSRPLVREALKALIERESARRLARLEHDPEKWVSGFRKRSCVTNNPERDDESKKSHRALGSEPDLARAPRRRSRRR